MAGFIRELLSRKNDISTIVTNPKKAVMFLFWPMLLSYLVVALNGYLDAFWVSFLGASESSAVNAMVDLYLAIGAVGAGMGVACSVTISFHLGEKNQERADSLATHSFLMTGIVSAVVGVLAYVLMGPFIDWMEIDDLRSLCYEYMMPLIVFNVLLLLNGTLCGILRAEGDAVRSTIATLLCITSAIFNPLFIVVLDYGIAGAAWGTIAGTAVSTIYLLSLFIRKTTLVNIRIRNVSFDKTALKELFQIGVPYSIQTGTRKLSNILEKVVIFVSVGFFAGTATIAVYALPWTYIHIFECFGLALGAALIPVMSFSIGDNNMENAEEAYRSTLKRIVIPTAICTGLLLVLAYPLASVFTTSSSMAEHRDMLVGFMMIIALAAPIYPIRDISFSVLQTIRRNSLCVIIAFFQIFAKLILMFILGTLYGPYGMVAGSVLSNWVGGLTAFLLSRHYWKRAQTEGIEFTSLDQEMIKRIKEQLGLS